jgi:CheY-like chemotaxis protein
LIVDDNSTSRRILSLQTQGWGLQPSLAGSLLKPLEQLRQGELRPGDP